MFKRWLMMSAWAPDGGAGTGGAGGASGAGAPPPAGGGAGGSPGAGAVAGAPGAAGASGGASAAPPVFAETLPADLRELGVFKDIKDLDGLARSYANAAKMVGMDKARIVALPAEDDAAGWNDFFAKAGRPEKPDGYGLKPPQGIAIDEKLQTAFTAKAHEAGLTTKQANALYEWWNGEAASARAQADGASAAALAAGEAALKTEWGNAYQQNLDLATKAFAHYGNPALKAELEKTGQGNSPELLKVFAKLGRQLSEDGLIGKGGTGGDVIASPTEARQQIAAKKADPAFTKAYIDKSHPGHAKAVQDMAALYEQAYPTVA